MLRIKLRDNVLLTGWLFADLLLGLMVIFLAAIPGAPHIPPKIPVITVSPLQLDPSNSACTGGNISPKCVVTLTETASSVVGISWGVSSDISDSIGFNPPKGVLSPGQSVAVTISNITCQNGSFTFSASRGTSPVVVSWHCKLPPQRLDFNYHKLNVVVHDIPGLLNSSPQAINDIEQQIQSQSVLRGRSVGLAIVYGGAPSDADIAQGQAIATKIYSILGMLGKQGFAFQKASYYVPLYSLGTPADQEEIDVYLFLV